MPVSTAAQSSLAYPEEEEGCYIRGISAHWGTLPRTSQKIKNKIKINPARPTKTLVLPLKSRAGDGSDEKDTSGVPRPALSGHPRPRRIRSSLPKRIVLRIKDRSVGEVNPNLSRDSFLFYHREASPTSETELPETAAIPYLFPGRSKLPTSGCFLSTIPRILSFLCLFLKKNYDDDDDFFFFFLQTDFTFLRGGLVRKAPEKSAALLSISFLSLRNLSLSLSVLARRLEFASGRFSRNEQQQQASCQKKKKKKKPLGRQARTHI